MTNPITASMLFRGGKEHDDEDQASWLGAVR